jgi:hypothetical protein
VGNKVGVKLNNQPKAAMSAAAVPNAQTWPNTKVIANAKRIRFTNAGKRRLLGAADRCATHWPISMP